MITLYYKRSSDNEDVLCLDGGCPYPTAVQTTPEAKKQSADFLGAPFNLAPQLEQLQTIDIILTNLVHACKKKDL